jgi:hypothetical protein
VTSHPSTPAPPSVPCRRRRVQHSTSAPRQLRLPRRPTCPPLRRSSRRDRGIQRRPDPVRWGARRVTPTDEVGIGPQASGPPSRQARASRRNGCWSSVGRRQPTAPAAPHQQRQGQVACRRTCQPACHLVDVGLCGLGRQAGLRQHCPPLPLPVHLCNGDRQQRKVLCGSSKRKLQWQPSRQGS